MEDVRTKILLIEDNPDDAMLIQETFADTGNTSYDWDWVDRLSDGLDRLSTDHFTVVLLDLSLPDSHGFETFTKAQERAPNVPIILMTGLEDEELALQAVQKGAQDYLVKHQVDGPTLGRSLSYAVERHRLLDEVVSRTKELSRVNTELELEVAERRRAEESLAKQAEELRRSNAELEQFAYVASHDLQEPLRMVSSYVKILSDDYSGRLDTDADRFIGYIVDGATRMKGLIDDLLTFSRVGTQGWPFEPTDCNVLIDRVISDQAETIAACEGVVTHDLLPIVNGDATQLAQVLQNLVSNALKYTRDVPPTVHISANEHEDAWVFSVSDNGMGIAPHHYERIFQMFQRLHHRSEYPGSGIGLAVCHKIVERHGGRIWVESEVGKGSTFHFTISSLQREAA